MVEAGSASQTGHAGIPGHSRGLLLAGLLMAGLACQARAVSWDSAATGSAITATVTEPDPAVATPALVVYLRNLSCERIGQESDASILADFTASGYRVVELDYASHARATTPFLNADVLKIRNEIGTEVFPGASGLNANKNQCYILCEGYRLRRDVPYFLNDPSVYFGSDSGAELRMDIAYPSQPSRAVPVVVEFSTSNSFEGNEDDRMRNDYAFTGTTDTILEGAPAAGIAWAMADHPKYREWGQPKSPVSYSGFEVNPDTIKKVRSAVRVLREVGAGMGLSGNIAVHGFSRGATAGSLAVGDRAVPEIDSAGYSSALSSRVQAVLLGSGIFDYSHSGGLYTGDPHETAVDIYDRFTAVWGPPAADPLLWQRQGALYYMDSAASSPVFLSYNTDDGGYYPYQAQLMEAKLVSLGVPHQVVTDTGGHRVTTNPETLSAIYDFFKTHAHPQPQPPGPALIGNFDDAAGLLDLTIDPNGNDAAVKYAIHTDGAVRQWIQSDGSPGPEPVWHTLEEWGSPLRVGPLTDLENAGFTVLAYDPEQFTTAWNGGSASAGPALGLRILDIRVAPASGEVSFDWPAPEGVLDPGELDDVVERSTALGHGWDLMPDLLFSISDGIVTTEDRTPPGRRAFYRVTRP